MRRNKNVVDLLHQASKHLATADALRKKSAEQIWHAGKLLIQVKAAVEHGKFGPLLKSNNISSSTAANAMSLARKVDHPSKLIGMQITQAMAEYGVTKAKKDSIRTAVAKKQPKEEDESPPDDQPDEFHLRLDRISFTISLLADQCGRESQVADSESTLEAIKRIREAMDRIEEALRVSC